MPVWQSVFAQTQQHGFTVLAVALDLPEAARPWIEAAAPTFPCLIDRDHRVAELYNMVNVPQAVWIAEDGRIVRPPETAGSTDGFRKRDPLTSAIPEEITAQRTRIKAAYFDAVRDWAIRGDASPYVLDEQALQARLKTPGPEVALAHAHFLLGQRLLRNGQTAAADAQFAEATRLHPESWAMWRQSAKKDERGIAGGADFWQRVDALGDVAFYPPNEIIEAAAQQVSQSK